ncbi:MAG: hypothetical protein NVS3B12_27530 [Acidimicrobiales bacterium]
MLIIHRLAQGGHRYYLDAVERGGRGGERPGEWIGGGATALGLAGPAVSRTQLKEILPAGKGRVPAFDATFAAPKSVSVLFGLGSPKLAAAVGHAHDEAVQAGLSYLERHACAGRSAGSLVTAAGFSVAAFRHRVSRAADPHLHTHALVINAVAAPGDGRRLALHSPLLYGERRAAGAVYHAVLRRELSESLGLEWEAALGGRADTTAVPPSVRRIFSGRNDEVLARAGGRLADRGWAQRVTRPERPADVDFDGLVTHWRERVALRGWEVPTPAPQQGLRRTGRPAADLTPGAPPAGDRWSRGDVVVALANGARSGATLAQLEAACAEVLVDPSVVPLGRGQGRQRSERFTTVTAQKRLARVSAALQTTVDASPLSLDRSRREFAAGDAQLLAVTPDASSAAALASRTGVEALGIHDVGVRAALLTARDQVVLVRPGRMHSAALEDVLRSCRAHVVAADPWPPIGPPVTQRLRWGELVQGGPLASVRTADGSITAAMDAPTALRAALDDWIAQRSRSGPDEGLTNERVPAGGVPNQRVPAGGLSTGGVLVGLPSEVDAINRWAREALTAAGMRGTVEVGGWAIGDAGWFGADRPRLGVARWDVATVVGVRPGEGRSAEVTMRIGRRTPARIRTRAAPREVTLRVSELAGLRPALAVPPYPSLVVGRGEVFVVGGMAPRLREAQPVHLYLTGAVRGWDVGPNPDDQTRASLRWASPGRLDELVSAARRHSAREWGRDRSSPVAPGFVEAVRELRGVADRSRAVVRATGRDPEVARRDLGRSR